jgi:hypothetical protein
MSYLVVEKGIHPMEDGTKLVADSYEGLVNE